MPFAPVYLRAFAIISLKKLAALTFEKFNKLAEKSETARV
jgi:hypothetical protein